MSETLNLFYTRFTRQYHTEPAINTAYISTLDKAIAGLKLAPWKQARRDIVPTMPLSDPTLTFEDPAYDTFKASGDAAASKQAAYVGMAAYRFTVPADALAGTPANIVSMTIQANADKFNWKGLLISAYISASETPSADWDELRTGDIATAIDGTFRGVLYDDTPATKTATNKSEAIILTPVSPLAPNTYLWVIVQLAGWEYNKYEYWIEGSGMLTGNECSVTFDRSVNADPTGTTFEYPVELEDLYEPSKVFPLGFGLRETVSGWGYASSGSMFRAYDVQSPLALACTPTYTLAIKSDGTIVGTGTAQYGELTGIPAGTYKSITASTGHCLAIRSDWLLVGWGTNANNRLPDGDLTNCISCGAGYLFSVGVKANGTVFANGTEYGNEVSGPPTTPTPAIACAAHGYGCALLLNNGTVAGYGFQTGCTGIRAGLTNAIAVAHGDNYVLALRSDGTVDCWGYSTVASSVPDGLNNVVAISAGSKHAMVLKSDGTVVCWGSNVHGETTVPNDLIGVTAIAASCNPQYSNSARSVVAATRGTQWFNTTASCKKSDAENVPSGMDSDSARQLMLTQAAARATYISEISADSGSIGVANTGASFYITATTCCLSYSVSLTNSLPNKIHFSLPSLVAEVYGELYIRVLFLKDTNTILTSPLSTLAKWQTLWNGGIPTGYTLLAATKVRHQGFVNSVTVPLPSPGYSGTFWMVVLPLHAPLTGDSTSWDITQTGFNTSSILLLRD